MNRQKKDLNCMPKRRIPGINSVFQTAKSTHPPKLTINIASAKLGVVRILPLSQRRRDDNNNKICTFEGGGPWGQRGQSSKNAVFRGKRHDNQILKVQIVLSRNFVVIAQATIFLGSDDSHTTPPKSATWWGRSFVGMVRGARSPSVARGGFPNSITWLP